MTSKEADTVIRGYVIRREIWTTAVGRSWFVAIST